MREDTIEICHLKKAYGEHVIFSLLLKINTKYVCLSVTG